MVKHILKGTATGKGRKGRGIREYFAPISMTHYLVLDHGPSRVLQSFELATNTPLTDVKISLRIHLRHVAQQRKSSAVVAPLEAIFEIIVVPPKRITRSHLAKDEFPDARDLVKT